MAKDINGNPIKFRSLTDFKVEDMPIVGTEYYVRGVYSMPTDPSKVLQGELAHDEVIIFQGLEKHPSGSVDGPIQVWAKFTNKSNKSYYFEYDFTEWTSFKKSRI